MKKFKEWLDEYFCLELLLIFLLFFGTIASIAYIGEKRKNNNPVHVMQEDVLYVRPEGFEERTDTINIEDYER